jgi:hypothetical protein
VAIPAPTQSASTAVPDTPEERLKAHGLIPSGSYYVVASEPEALVKCREINALIAQLDQAFGKYAQVFRNKMLLAGAEEYRDLIKGELDSAKSDLSNRPNGARDNSMLKEQYAMAKSVVDGLNLELQQAQAQVDALQGLQVADGVREELRKDYDAKWSIFLKAADEVAKLIEQAKDDHRKAENDPAVTAALDVLRRSTKAAPTLGTTRNLQNELERIRKAAQRYSLEASAPKKRTRPKKPSKR